MLRNLIFDLDGTLIDSRPGISACARHAVASVLPERTLEDFAPYIGLPLAAGFVAALGPLEASLQSALVTAFRERYLAGGWREARCYPGAAAVLERLQAQGLRVFVLTNKPQAPTRLLLEHFELAGRVEAAHSLDTVSPPHATKVEALAHLLAAHGLDRTETWLVGDSQADKEAAEAHGVRFVAASYGYGGLEGPAHLGRLEDLIALVAPAAPALHAEGEP